MTDQKTKTGTGKEKEWCVDINSVYVMARTQEEAIAKAREEVEKGNITIGDTCEEAETEEDGLKMIYGMDELPDDALTSADVPKAKFEKMRKTGDYVFYTQVDGDDNKVYYVRGNVYVNRTGVYALVKKVN